MTQHLTPPTARKAHVILDPNEWVLLREQFEAGHTVSWLAREWRVSRQTINNRRKLGRWLRKTPGALASSNLALRLAEPVATLHDAARVTCQRALAAFNADDREAVRDLARLAELLSRLSCKFEPNSQSTPARPGGEPVFTPIRDYFQLLAERTGAGAQEDEA